LIGDEWNPGGGSGRGPWRRFWEGVPGGVFVRGYREDVLRVVLEGDL